MKQTINNLLAALIMMLTAATFAGAATLTVTNTDDSGAGSLRQAITDANAAADADTIVFASPLFDTAQTITLATALPNISNPLTITGRGARLLTVQRSTVAGTPNFSVFRNNFSITAALSGMTVTNGRTTTGGGINNAGTLTLDGMNITGNFAELSNTNGGGGGIINAGSASLLTILNSTISGNTNLTGRGSGLRLSDGIAFIANSTISGNSCASGDTAGNGGIVVIAGTLNMNNVTVTNNSVTNNAGAATKTGGIFVGTATVNVRNTIIAGNTTAIGSTTPDLLGTFVSNGNNLVGNTTGGTGFTQPTDKLNVAANLAALANNGGQTDSYLPNAGSPAIDAGNNCVVTATCGTNNPPAALTTDQRGNYVRQRGTAVDIGAVEYLAPTAAGASISGRVLVGAGRGLVNAAVYLTDANGRTRSVQTSAFGYYRFNDIAAGQTIIVTVVSKRYQFAPQVVSLTDALSEINFVALP